MKCENKQPVLTSFMRFYRAEPMTMDNKACIPTDRNLTRVLMAVDGSDYSKRATEVAVTLCKAVNSELVAFHAIHVPRYSLLIGSVSSAVVNHAHCSILVAR